MFSILEFIKKFFKENPSNMHDVVSNQNRGGFGASVFNYGFLLRLDSKEYPKYLEEAYRVQMGKKLNLKHPKTINEKIQWLKIYDDLPIKTELTDKVLVRDWVKNKIGEQYLKPVCQICNSFDEIDFDKLPNSIALKCNHGCKWHCFIKNKEKFLSNDRAYEYTKQQVEGWLSQSFFAFSDFETQYKNIRPQLIIEPYFDKKVQQIQVWCFNGIPKIIQKIWKEKTDSESYAAVATFDENYNSLNLNFTKAKVFSKEIDECTKKAVELSKKLSEDFIFVRVDFMVTEDKLYFEEMTFTPFSGYITTLENDEYWQKEMGNMLILKGKQHGKKQ